MTLAIILAIFTATIIGFIWLVKRAKPEKRIHWFVGCSILSIFVLGIIQGPIAIIASLGILAFIQKEDERPLKDIGEGALSILGSGFAVAFYALYMLIGIGGIYWLWLAIQIKSFTMFILGIFPLSFIFTAPVGAYSLVFGMPNWIQNWLDRVLKRHLNGQKNFLFQYA